MEVNPNIVPTNLMNESSKIGLKQAKTAINDPNSILVVHPKDGTIHAVAIAKIKEHSPNFNAPAVTHEVGKNLLVAAKLLKGEKLTSEEKGYKATAKKVVKASQGEFEKANNNKKISDDQKKILGNELAAVSTALKEKHIDQLILAFSKTIDPIDSQFVSKIFQNIENHAGVGVDPIDILRHVDGGMVAVNIQGKDLFSATSIAVNDESKTEKKEQVVGEEVGIESEELNEEDQVAAFVNTLEVIVLSFVDPASVGASVQTKNVLKDSVATFMDNLRTESDKDSCVTVIEKQMKSWAKSDNPAEVNMSRLMHGINQRFYVLTSERTTRRLTEASNLPNSANELLSLGPLALRSDPNSKKITYNFTADEVILQHHVSFNVLEGQDKVDKKVSVEQQTTYRAKLNDLENWDYKAQYTVNVKDPSAKDLAVKINRSYTTSGLSSKLNL